MFKLDSSSADFARQSVRLYNRPGYPPEIEIQVKAIIDGVRDRGDAALIEYAAEFDHAELTPASLRVSDSEIDEAIGKVDPASKKAIDRALRHVRSFAGQRIPRAWHYSPRPGVRLGERFVPMSRVGVYIPGGTAPLVSTVIHTAGIASAAGVKEIVAVTPPGRDGRIHPAVLYAMKKSGVTEIYRLGGVYGVAALAYGTESVPKVEKIVGPGNAYVTAAKKLVYGAVAIDMVAGPSEIMVVADDSARAEFIAADLLSQAEHGSGLEQAVLVSTSQKLIDEVALAVERRKLALPRLETVEKVLANGTFLIKAASFDEAIEIAGKYAPEHLELHCRNARRAAGRVKACGAIFIGPWTPEPIGDFCAGPSHVLPTAGSGRFFGGLSVEGFFRRMSTVEYTEKAVRKEIPVVERFAGLETLTAHGLSGTVRRSNRGNESRGDFPRK